MSGNIIFGSMLLLCLTACKQSDPSKDAKYLPITSQALKDAATVRVGSYFVYQDSASGATDSFAVTVFNPPAYNYDNRDNTYNENTGFRSFAEKRSGAISSPEISAAAYKNFFGVSVSLNDTATSGMLIRLPFTIGLAEYNNGITFTYLQHHNAYSVFGNSYSDVYEVSATDSNSGKTLHTWYATQPAGLIRFTITLPRSQHTYLLKKALIIH